MKKEDMILMAMVLAGILVLPKLMGKKAFAATSRGTSTAPSTSQGAWVYEVARDNGWVYYSDGTSIGPDGTYYKNTDTVYSPGGMYQ